MWTCASFPKVRDCHCHDVMRQELAPNAVVRIWANRIWSGDLSRQISFPLFASILFFCVQLIAPVWLHFSYPIFLSTVMARCLSSCMDETPDIQHPLFVDARVFLLMSFPQFPSSWAASTASCHTCARFWIARATQVSTPTHTHCLDRLTLCRLRENPWLILVLVQPLSLL